jgi:hypothetical protein
MIFQQILIRICLVKNMSDGEKWSKTSNNGPVNFGKVPVIVRWFEKEKIELEKLFIMKFKN